MAKQKFYAVKAGKSPGIYLSWAECENQVKGFPGAKFKSFGSREEAENWIQPKEELAIENGIEIFVDGSFSPQSKYSGWGMVVVEKNEEIEFRFGKTARPALSRNIDGEVEAACQAMEYLASKDVEGTVYFDYQGIESWYTGEWQAKSEIAKEYVERAKQLNARVRFKKVKAHSGNRWNDRADELAKKGIES